ncbi:MAG: hypothetical protein ACJAR2_000808, partial [Ilumatobacter sp.]
DESFTLRLEEHLGLIIVIGHALPAATPTRTVRRPSVKCRGLLSKSDRDKKAVTPWLG